MNIIDGPNASPGRHDSVRFNTTHYLLKMAIDLTNFVTTCILNSDSFLFETMCLCNQHLPKPAYNELYQGPIAKPFGGKTPINMLRP